MLWSCLLAGPLTRPGRRRCRRRVGHRPAVRRRPLLLPWPHCPHILDRRRDRVGQVRRLQRLDRRPGRLPNVAICGIDLKLVELSPWRDRLTVLAITPAEADRLLVDLRNLIARPGQMARANGYRKWEERFGPWLVLVVDELGRTPSPRRRHPGRRHRRPRHRPSRAPVGP